MDDRYRTTGLRRLLLGVVYDGGKDLMAVTEQPTCANGHLMSPSDRFCGLCGLPPSPAPRPTVESGPVVRTNPTRRLGLALLVILVLIAGVAIGLLVHRSTGKGTNSADTVASTTQPASVPGSIVRPTASVTTTSTTTSEPTASASPTSVPGPNLLVKAQATVRAHGFVPSQSTGFASRDELSAIVGVPEGSADGGGTQVFFFIEGRSLGTDAIKPSSQSGIASSTGDTIVVSYRLYHNGDPFCCNTAGDATVRFHWDGSRVVALDPIPPVDGDPYR